jgi:voltage-gated potassium channel
MTTYTLKERLKELYEGDSAVAHKFRYGLLAFDAITVIFIIVSSFLHSTATEFLDTIIGAVLVADFLARIWISNSRRKMLMSPFGVADIVVIVSLLAPIVGEGLAFLRVARILRLLRSYQVLRRLRHDFRWFRIREETTLSALNLAIFLFIITAIVYETQRYTNPQIANYVDALYFTVTTLTTTGFGDIVLKGTLGRLIAVVTMIVGVSLFLRLIQVMLRPDKVQFLCPDCGLQRHERDAVHCKACGRMLNIPDEGTV